MLQWWFYNDDNSWLLQWWCHNDDNDDNRWLCDCRERQRGGGGGGTEILRPVHPSAIIHWTVNGRITNTPTSMVQDWILALFTLWHVIDLPLFFDWNLAGNIYHMLCNRSWNFPASYCFVYSHFFNIYILHICFKSY